MKQVLFALIFILGFGAYSQAPLADELVKIHSVSNAQMNAIVNPIEGTLIFNTDDRTCYYYDGVAWKTVNEPTSKTVILNRDGGSLPNATNTFFNLPVDASHIQTIDNTLYNVSGTAQITILEAGNYLLSGEISTTNMPSGDVKFILGVFINGTRRGYLSRGSVNLPSRDFWGTTGTLMYALQENDVVSIRYVLNAGGTPLNANFSNIGITKI